MAIKKIQDTIIERIGQSWWYKKLHKDEAVGWALIILGLILLLANYIPALGILRLWPAILIVIGYWVLIQRGGPGAK